MGSLGAMIGHTERNIWWDYMQDDRPTPDPENSYVSWLRTSDMKEFIFDKDNNRWVSIGGGMHYTGSGPNSAGSPGAAEQFRMHNIIFQDANGLGWYPPEDQVIMGGWWNSSVAAQSGASIHMLVNGSSAWNSAWGGTQSNTESIDLEVRKEDRVIAEVRGGLNVLEPNPSFWMAGFWVKEFVDETT
jgi:hypothetical protein